MIDRIYSMEIETGTHFTEEAKYNKIEVCKEVCKELVDAVRCLNKVLHSSHIGDCRTYLANGCCVYVDMNHFEFCLPECKSVADVLAYDRAAMVLIEHAASALEEKLRGKGVISPSGRFLVLKNNVCTAADLAGFKQEESHGTHENYSLNIREVRMALAANRSDVADMAKLYASPDKDHPLSYVGMMMVPFLVSRQVLCGSGSVVCSGGLPLFEISQRSRFMKTVISLNAVSERGIANLRDEPHAAGYYRVHVICGDANMCQFADWLKMGVTGLVTRLIEENGLPPSYLQLVSPVQTMHAVSRDVELLQRYEVYYKKELKLMSAIDMQQCIVDQAKKLTDKHGTCPEEQFTLQIWQETLDLLRSDPRKLVGKIDWVTKRELLDKEMRKSGFPFEHPQIRALDDLYHALDGKESVYYTAVGESDRLVKEVDVQRALTCPPHTRAQARTRVVHDLMAKGNKIDNVRWDIVTSGDIGFVLPDPFDATPKFS